MFYKAVFVREKGIILICNYNYIKFNGLFFFIDYIETIATTNIVQKMNSCYYLSRSVIQSVIELNATPSHS